MTVIRTLIVDDEPLARDGIRLLISPDSQFEIIGECSNGKEAIAAIKKLRPDLVFLDVQMPEVDGFGVLKSIREEDLPLVVFVTAFDKFAIDAFEAHALDYVLKPVNPVRFATTITRIKKRLSEKRSSADLAPSGRAAQYRLEFGRSAFNAQQLSQSNLAQNRRQTAFR